MSDSRFDVAVVGAGIHGAGVAQAAAAAGYSVVVLEQTAIAAGTSSRSSKLIHGGLRYLETAQLGLVRECLAERALLLRLAPELVRLVPFHIPVYLHTQRRLWQLTAGLSLYAVLGGLARETRFARLPRRDWSALDGLACDDLQTVFRYYDAQTDDVALTRAVLVSAQTLGAEVRMPARVVRIELDTTGCTIGYVDDQGAHSLHASVLVNASGPWVDATLATVTSPIERRGVDLVQGAHIVVDGALQAGIYYLEAPVDGRAVFAMPWQGHTLIGTTETPYCGDPAAVAPLQNEQDYLLEIFRRYFPSRRDALIRHAFAGLRVLPKATGKAFARPRETMLIMDRPRQPRILSIYGGKLTAYRATAVKVLRRIRGSLPTRPQRADTRRLMLHPA